MSPIAPIPSLAIRSVLPAVLLALLASAALLHAQPPRPALFHGGAAHGGRLDAEPVRTPGPYRWELETGGPVRSSPVVFGDTVYCGSHDGHLYAVELATGVLRWKAHAPGPLTSAPAVTEDLVVAATHDGELTAFGRLDGAPRWRVEVGPTLPWAWGNEGWDYLGSSPVIAGDLVLAGAGDGRVRAVDLGSGAVRWTVRTDGRVRSPVAVEGGLAVVGSADGIVRALRLENGDEVWRFETRGVALDAADFGYDRRTLVGGATLDGDRLYIGSRDAALYALDRADGRQLWLHDDGGDSAWVISTPALADDLVLFGRSSSAKLQALSPDSGELRWEQQLAGPVFASPAVTGGLAYVSTGGSGELVAVDVASGEIRWRRRLGAASYSSPTVAGGLVIVGADDGVVRAVEAAPAGAAPRLAVFHDPALDARSLLARQGRDDAIADFLAERGFERLDAVAAVAFLEERIANRSPSVVVMATDVVPEPLAPGPEPEGLLVRYLEAGGKVVWVGAPPFWLERNEETGGFSADIARPHRFLGVDHGAWVGDSRMVRPTPAGRAWGLEGWWMGPGGVDPAGVSTVLAADSEGGATAWVKSWGGTPGSGWVTFPWAPGPRWLEHLRAAAEAGILRIL